MGSCQHFQYHQILPSHPVFYMMTTTKSLSFPLPKRAGLCHVFTSVNTCLHHLPGSCFLPNKVLVTLNNLNLLEVLLMKTFPVLERKWDVVGTSARLPTPA